MSLSDKRVKVVRGFNDPIYRYDEEDVKEFIKELKDDLHLNISTSPLVTKIIDLLAGEKLV